MFGNIKQLLRKLVLKEKSSSEEYIKYLKSKGVRIGEQVHFYSPRTTLIDITRPWLVEIGNDVHITHGVVVLTHGYDWSVIRGVSGDVLGSSGKVTIGNNVFIGANTTILKGVKVGSNVIIGASSLVNKNIPNNCVFAGNPARYICDLDTYTRKRREEQQKEATELVREYYKCYHKIPTPDVLSEFYWLFEKRCDKLPGYSHQNFSYERNRKNTVNTMKERYYKTQPVFDSYEAFIKSCNLNE